MPSPDPVGELVLLARAAADAGLDWQARLRQEWLPRTVATTPRTALEAAVAEWSDEAPDAGGGLGGRLETAVVAAMAEQGYD
ncbi:MAG: hypothetical protein PHQ91_03230 [Thermoanaerobaculaceae bacterium]|nr:hypothetical protein [Thermoanaerobaculaceae bacterium]TAM47291.1 MAG: hypothetical protein EPN53_12065 [Acidobacteriota bacterium]